MGDNPRKSWIRSLTAINQRTIQGSNLGRVPLAREESTDQVHNSSDGSPHYLINYFEKTISSTISGSLRLDHHIPECAQHHKIIYLFKKNWTFVSAAYTKFTQTSPSRFQPKKIKKKRERIFVWRNSTQSAPCATVPMEQTPSPSPPSWSLTLSRIQARSKSVGNSKPNHGIPERVSRSGEAGLREGRRRRNPPPRADVWWGRRRSISRLREARERGGEMEGMGVEEIVVVVGGGRRRRRRRRRGKFRSSEKFRDSAFAVSFHVALGGLTCVCELWPVVGNDHFAHVLLSFTFLDAYYWSHRFLPYRDKQAVFGLD